MQWGFTKNPLDKKKNDFEGARRELTIKRKKWFAEKKSKKRSDAKTSKEIERRKV